MSLSEENVKKIAKLARIKLSEDEIKTYHQELSQIIHWVEQLQSVDTTGVEPCYSVVTTPLPLRDDVVTEVPQVEQVLQNAPEARFDYFVVPKVIE